MTKRTPEEINTLKAIQRNQKGYKMKDKVYASPGIVEIPTPSHSFDHLVEKVRKLEMKKKGGVTGKKKKFPDLSGDGKVTKKDILMARGVIKKPKKKKTK